MEPIKIIDSRTVVLPYSDIDTDQILPARFLKTTTREGLGEKVFADWRYQADGTPKAEFVLNTQDATGCEVLVAGRNFGCGSSREHAPWALADYGFRVIIATSFADIFYNNCFENGILPIALDGEIIDDLFARATGEEPLQIAVDLPEQTLTRPDGEVLPFTVHHYRKHCLLEGLDAIGQTLQHRDAIRAYEEHRRQHAPWLFANSVSDDASRR